MNQLRKLLPASLLTLSGCALFLLLLPLSILDVLSQVGCEQCFASSPELFLVANGIEERTLEPQESPGLPPIETVDQEPADAGFLAALDFACDQLFALADFGLGTGAGASQTITQIRSGGFALVGSQDPAARLGGNTPASSVLYMTNAANNTVLAIDAQSRSLLGSVRVGARPRGIAATPDGARLFVANEVARTVSVIDAATLTELRQVPLSNEAEPYDVAVTPDGAEVWVTGHELSGQIHVLDADALEVIDTIRVGRRPVQVAISPDGTLAYVTNEADNRLSIIDVWTHSVQRSIEVPSPYAVEFDPTGARVYVSSRTDPGEVRMYDAGSDALLASWEVGEKPEHLRLDAFATRLFVTNRLSPFLSVINLLSGELETTIPAPRGLGPMAGAL